MIADGLQGEPHALAPDLSESSALSNPLRDVQHMTQDSWINQSINQPINNQALVLLAITMALIGGCKKNKKTILQLTRGPGGSWSTLSSDDCANWFPMLVLLGVVRCVCVYGVCVSSWLWSGGGSSSSTSSRCSQLC